MTRVEICIDDLERAIWAEAGGADRVEVCADLHAGGTTPSLGLVRAILTRTTTIGLQVMVRPRGGDFVYSAGDVEVMRLDIRELRALADSFPGRLGIVTGALTEAAQVDELVLSTLLREANPLPVTFHMAFDVSQDRIASFRVLARLGIDRILTSGGAPSAQDGIQELASLAALAGSETGPTILAGGGIRSRNAPEIVTVSGVTEVHLRAQKPSARGDGTLQTDLDEIIRICKTLD